MIKAGERLWNGAIASAEFAAVYNAMQSRIQSFKDEGKPVPEYLLNGSHNLMNSVPAKRS